MPQVGQHNPDCVRIFLANLNQETLESPRTEVELIYCWHILDNMEKIMSDD